MLYWNLVHFLFFPCQNKSCLCDNKTMCYFKDCYSKEELVLFSKESIKKAVSVSLFPCTTITSIPLANRDSIQTAVIACSIPEASVTLRTWYKNTVSPIYLIRKFSFLTLWNIYFKPGVCFYLEITVPSESSTYSIACILMVTPHWNRTLLLQGHFCDIQTSEHPHCINNVCYFNT